MNVPDRWQVKSVRAHSLSKHIVRSFFIFLVSDAATQRSIFRIDMSSQAQIRDALRIVHAGRPQATWKAVVAGQTMLGIGPAILAMLGL